MSQALTLHPDFSPATKTGGIQTLSRPSLSYWEDAWIRLKKNKQALASLIIIIGLLAFTLIGPLLWTADPAAQELSRVSEPPTFGRTALVIGEPSNYEEVVDPNVPETPDTVSADMLPAPAALDFIGVPSIGGVRLKWSAVAGAVGYIVYRSEVEPKNGNLGYVVGEVTGGNKISYQDQFSIQPVTYYYSVLAKSEVESNQAVTRKITLTRTVNLPDAQAIDPNATEGMRIELPSHPIGTDVLGRDVLARLMQGGRVSLGIGFFAPLISTIVGVLVGGISGFLGGKTDAWIMRFTDFVLALPFLLFVILFKLAFGAGAGESGITAMVVALVALSWTSTARLTRGQILQLREMEFVHASRLLGAKPLYLVLRHLLPNTLGVIMVSLTFEIPRAIFTEAFLSFIGMGVVPPTPSWGSMCSDGTQSFLTSPHEFLFPALIISITVLAFNLLGDGLRDALDPRMRSVQ